MTVIELDEETADSGEPSSTHGDRRRYVRIGIAALIGALAVVLLGGLAFAWWLNSSLDHVTRFDVDVPESSRIAQTEADDLTIVLLGTDSGAQRGTDSILEAVTAAEWPRGDYRSDATMLLHLPADRDEAYIVSFPRDAYVPLYDELGEPVGSNKINAALSLYGPTGAMLTLENVAGLRIDHIAIVDWDGFADITDALGGVSVKIPGEGTTELDGDAALDYVRERYDLPNGDFDRVRRQQNFLRAMSEELMSQGIVGNPQRLKSSLDAVTSHLAVDDGWTNGDIRSLAWSLRDLDPEDIHFITVPHHGTDTVQGVGSVVVLDETGTQELFRALRSDSIDAWLAANPQTRLGETVH